MSSAVHPELERSSEHSVEERFCDFVDSHTFETGPTDDPSFAKERTFWLSDTDTIIPLEGVHFEVHPPSVIDGQETGWVYTLHFRQASSYVYSLRYQAQYMGQGDIGGFQHRYIHTAARVAEASGFAVDGLTFGTFSEAVGYEEYRDLDDATGGHIADGILTKLAEYEADGRMVSE